jgi:peptidoglycan pentaglycine glycine transferase (the first glycine)
MNVPESDRWSAWDRFLEATPDTGFMQSSWYADFRASVGYECFGVLVKDAETIVAGAMVMKWRYAPDCCFYYISDGPVLPLDESAASEALDVILQIIEKHRKSEAGTVSHLRIEPRWRSLPAYLRAFQPLTFRDEYTEPRNTLCVDLRPPEVAILAQMKPKGRYNIRVARRYNVSVVEDNSDQGLADFLRIYGRTVARHAIDGKPPGYFRTLLGILSGRHQVSLYFAEYGGRRLAAALVVYFGNRATYYFGGSLAIHRRTMAPYLLHFEIMRKAKARGCEWYDLWGVAPQGATNDPWQDISAFKRKFGGEEVSLVPTLDLVFDQQAYTCYAAGTHADDAPHRFPGPPHSGLEAKCDLSLKFQHQSDQVGRAATAPARTGR